MKQFIISIAVSMLLLTGCGSSSSESTKAEIKTESQATENQAEVASEKSQTMLFFINPNGLPCKRQDAILNDMKSELQKNNVKIEYVSTADLDTSSAIFQQYGVRMLPTIILLDENGAEKKRFAAGVHGKHVLLEAIN